MAMPESNMEGTPRERLPSTTEDTENAIAQFQRLTLNTASATALPPSPQVASPRRASTQRNQSSSPGGRPPPRSPLPRSPSSMSIDARSSSPTLHRKASMNSLHGVGGITPPRSMQSRRSSSAHLLNGQAPTFMARSPLSGVDDMPSTPLPPTAASIASTHFSAELNSLMDDTEGRSADTVVILQDSCYGHRFSRPNPKRDDLGSVVERPERIQAAVLGISAAYVRLGQRHAEGRYPPHPKKDPSTIHTIPFRIQKTIRTLPLSSPAVTNIHGAKWMEELKSMCDSAEAKLAMNGKELVRQDVAKGSNQEAPPALHEGDLYLCADSLDAIEGALGAVCEGVDAVFQGSATHKGPHHAFIAIRPPGHHCSTSFPSGFCWLNNVHVGISHAMINHGLTHAAIIDFDLHHGDGSQAITFDHNERIRNLPKNAPNKKKTSIAYFSLHDINSYPCEYGDAEKVKNASFCIDNAHGQSIWNVHLQPWTGETEFWELYETKYSILLEKARGHLRAQTRYLRTFPNIEPKGAIFLSAGFDASEWETAHMQRHKVNVPTEFYARLARDVVKLAAEEDCAVDGRIISVLEGGYSDRALTSGVLSHISGLAGGDAVAVKREVKLNGLGYEMARKAGISKELSEEITASDHDSLPAYDPTWWAIGQLEQLDALVHPPPPLPEPKKVRDAGPPTYSSPTQSFMGKVVKSPRVRRSTSNLNGLNDGSPGPKSRPPSPPAPEVHWATAAHELSKLLIPSDKRTTSYKFEELSNEAPRVKRERQSMVAAPAPVNATISSDMPSARMSLRDRKSAKPLGIVKDEEAEKASSKAGRRKTVAGGTILATEKVMTGSTGPRPEPSFKQPTKQSARRLSVSSNAGFAVTAAPPRQIPDGHTGSMTNGPVHTSQRPGSSQSVRPGSSLSSRDQPVSTVIVKRSRTINPTRPETVKTSRVIRKTPPAVRSNGFGNDGAGDMQPVQRVPSLSETTNRANTSKAYKKAVTPLDTVTTGVKKITINLPSKAQREAKEQANQAPISNSSTLASSEQASHPIPSAMPSEDQASYSSPSNMPERKDSLQKSIPSTPQPLPSSRFAHLQDASTIPLPASSPLPRPSEEISSHDAAAPTTKNSSASNIFVPYQPEGPPPVTMFPKEPLTWLPPNSSTPPPAMMQKRNDLPVFSSTGAIPFAATNGTGSVKKSLTEESASESASAENVGVPVAKVAAACIKLPPGPGEKN